MKSIYYVSIIDMDFLYREAAVLEMRPNHKKKKQPASDIGQLSDFTVDIGEDTNTKPLLIRVQTRTTRMNCIATKKPMMNMTKRQRGDWPAKWLMLGFMDLRRAMVSRRSTSVFLYLLESFISDRTKRCFFYKWKEKANAGISLSSEIYIYVCVCIYDVQSSTYIKQPCFTYVKEYWQFIIVCYMCIIYNWCYTVKRAITIRPVWY